MKKSHSWTIVSLALLVGTGCAANAGSPFHIYGSPTLETKSNEHARNASHRAMVASTRRVYELAPDRSGSGRAVVVRESSSGGSRASEGAHSTTRSPRTPTLSVVRRDDLSENPQFRSGDRPEAAAAYVVAQLATHGVELPSKAAKSVPALYRACASKAKVTFETPLAPGQVVFFHNTFDANSDRRNNDWYTHAAIVVNASGKTARLSGFNDGAVRTFDMDLEDPTNGANSQLRPSRSDDAPFTRYLSGELFAGACKTKTRSGSFEPNASWRP